MSFQKATLVLLGSGHGDALQDPAGIQLQREHLPINPAGQHMQPWQRLLPAPPRGSALNSCFGIPECTATGSAEGG